MNDFFLDLGLSWTLSKTLPYVLCILLGILIFLFLRRKMKPGLVRKLLILVIAVPFGIYFAFSPIYEGDFSNNFRKFSEINDSLDFQKNTLTVIAIPNCPYCAESIDRLNKLSERSGKKTLNFVVLSSDPETTTNYREMASTSIAISNDSVFRKYESITQGSYPTFVYRNDEGVYVWGNDVFGVRAMDWVESALNK